MPHPFIELKKACDLVGRDVLYNILVEFCIPVKVIRLIKVCLNEFCSTVRVSKHLSDMFPIRNGLKQGGVIRRVQVNHDRLKLIDTHQLLTYTDDVNILRGNLHTMKENKEVLLVISKEIGL